MPCFRNLSAPKLLNLSSTSQFVTDASVNPWQQWWPTIDGYVLSQNAFALYESRALNAQRTIFGFNSQV